MVTVNDIIRLTDFQVQENQEILNVYFYRAVDLFGVVTLAQFIEKWRSDFLPFVLDIQHPDLLHQRQAVDNLSLPAEYAEFSQFDPGAFVGGEAAPLFNAIGYDLLKLNKVTRKGAKRYGGVPDDLILGSVVDTTYTALNDLQIALGAVILVDQDPPAGCNFQPIIVGSDPLGGYDLSRTSDITGGELRLEVTSQTSRKLTS